MAQIFHPSANSLARLSIVGGGLAAAGAVVVTYLVISSPYQTNVDVAREQPVPFSHEHHVNGPRPWRRAASGCAASHPGFRSSTSGAAKRSLAAGSTSQIISMKAA